MTHRPVIKNIVFDIGNVVVRWDPALILSRTFGDERANDTLLAAIFKHDLWYSLNRGQISEQDAKIAYSVELGFGSDDMDALFFHAKDSQDLRADTVALMTRLSENEYRLFALTDNVREIVSYLQSRYDFWSLFEGAIVSAEVGTLKPSRDIFQHLLSTFDLQPEETVFFDDMQHNVEGAQALGIPAFQFINAAQAETDLVTLGVQL